MKNKLTLLTVLGLLYSGMSFAANDYANLIGKYDMPIKIGERVFNDVLHITRVNKDDMRNETFEGTLTVPGRFTAALENTSLQIAMWDGIAYLNFEVVATENGKEFVVKYKAEKKLSFRGETPLVGEAFLEDGTKLGDFTATKIEEEEK